MNKLFSLLESLGGIHPQIEKRPHSQFAGQKIFLSAVALTITFIVSALYAALIPTHTYAQETAAATSTTTEPKFYRATVIDVVDKNDVVIDGAIQPSQLVKLRIDNGDRKGQEVLLTHGGYVTIRDDQKAKVDQRVVLVTADDGVTFNIQDRYRTSRVLWLIGGFFALAVTFGRWRGFTALIGLGCTAVVIVWWIVPRIVDGHDPFWTCVQGGVVIATASLFISHGFSKKVSLAWVSSIVTLGITCMIAIFSVSFLHLMGFGSEEAYEIVFLQIGKLSSINFQGLLLGGIIIGALGVLDDITTTQVAAVNELKSVNPAMRFSELYTRGIRIGREHIASLINTLVLAYTGASFPLVLLFANTTTPWWAIINTEFITEEIVRTLVGSSALILAVPISTLVAAWWYNSHAAEAHDAHRHSHTHTS